MNSYDDDDEHHHDHHQHHHNIDNHDDRTRFHQDNMSQTLCNMFYMFTDQDYSHANHIWTTGDNIAWVDESKCSYIFRTLWQEVNISMNGGLSLYHALKKYESKSMDRLTLLERQVYSDKYFPPIRSLEQSMLNLAFLIDSMPHNRLVNVKCAHEFVHDKHLFLLSLLFRSLVTLSKRVARLTEKAFLLP